VDRKLLWRLGLSLTALTLLALPAPGAQDEDEDAPPPTQLVTCHLHVSIDERGTATVGFSLISAKLPKVRRAQVEKALAGVIGSPLRQTQWHRTPTANVVSLTGRADEAFPPEGRRIEGELDLAPLADLVRPFGASTIDVWVNEAPTRPTSLVLRAPQVHRRISTAAPESVPFALGPRWGALAWRGAVLAGLFLVPLALVLAQRRAALRARDPALAWYRFWRLLHWATLGTWVVWVTAVPALALDALFLQAWPGGVGRMTSVRLAVTLLPPWLITVACAALAQDVFAHLSKAPQPPGTIFRRAAWGLVTTLLPWLLALVGLFSLLEGGNRGGVLWLAAAFGVRLLATRLATRGQDLAPWAITQGELYERIADLARQAGVSLHQLAVLPTGKMPQANAVAVLGGSVLITDHLLRSLSRREVDAVAAHELAHLKFRHPAWLLLLLLGAVAVPVFTQPLLPEWWRSSAWLQHLPIGLMLALLALYYVMRRFEHQTDTYAAWLTGDPEALITALIKIHRLSLMPMKWGRWEEGVLTHPSTSRRLEEIARQNGVSRRRLQEVVEAPDQPGESYSVPDRPPDAGLIFSPAFRARSIKWNARTMLAAFLLTPGLVAAAVWWGGLEGAARWGALAGGVVLSAAVMLAVRNYLPVRGYTEVRRRLAEKLARGFVGEVDSSGSLQPRPQGIDPAALGGTFVSFAPDPSPRVYGGYLNWDFGFLFLLGDRLCYVGERARFALRRDQVTAVRLGAGPPRWWYAPYVYVSWRDAEGGKEGTFNVRAGEVRTMRRLKPATVALGGTLRQWWEQPAGGGEQPVPPPLGELAPPALPQVSSHAVGALLHPFGLVYHTGRIFVLGVGLSLLLGLPFRLEGGGLAWYGPAVACLTFWLELLPVLWGRTSERDGSRGPAPTSSSAPPPARY
jgi:Zn-dependent protease with chaperone function